MWALYEHSSLLSFLTIMFSLFHVASPFCVNSPRAYSINRVNPRDLGMKWIFGKIPGATGSFKDFGGVGSQGEIYYIPATKPRLKAPAAAIGKEKVIPLFPRNQVLGPMGEDYLLVYEMRYWQLFNDVGEGGLCGHIFYSQENSRLALVGTLTRVAKIDRLDDGGMYVVMEGVGRFFIRDMISEKPYLKAKVQLFNDYVENSEQADLLERSVFEEIRYSVKIMKMLYPQNNYTMNDGTLRYQPQNVYRPNVRSVNLGSDVSELQRKSKFCLATIEMLKTDPATKLGFIQEPILERRYSKMLKILSESTSFLESELRKRVVMTDEALKNLRQEVLSDLSDLEPSSSKWGPNSNFVDGDWKMKAIPM